MTMKLTNFSFSAVAVAAAMLCASCNSNAKTDATETTGEETIEATTDEATQANIVSAANAVAGEVNELGANSVLQPAALPVIIDFSATWCGPCQQFRPIFHAAAAANADKFIFYSVDVDECPEMAQLYSVSSIPQVSVLYPDGSVYNHTPGYMDADQFNAFLETVKK